MSNPVPEIRTAMLLAAGFGTRMKELTRNRPKALLPLGDQTLIDIHLQALQNAGLRRVVINLHYRAEQIRYHLDLRNYQPMDILFSEEEVILGTGGGIAHAAEYFEDETILVVNSDVICDINIAEMTEFHYRQGGIATMAVWPSSNADEYALVEYDHDLRLVGFFKRGDSGPLPSHSAIFTGYQILSPEARGYLQPVFSSVIDTFYQRALEKNEIIKIFPHRGRWIDIGTRNQYLAVSQRVKDGELTVS